MDIGSYQSYAKDIFSAKSKKQIFSFGQFWENSYENNWPEASNKNFNKISAFSNQFLLL
jgi:hypothetical protein